MKLTKRAIDAINAPASRTMVWDDDLPGFGLRIEASGRKTFICRYRFGSVRRQVTIGRYGVVTPDAARQEAKRILWAVAQGEDPASERDRKRKAATLGDLIEQFLEEHGQKLKPATREDYARALRTYVVPALGHLKAEQVSAADLNRVHLSLADRPYRANRVMAYLGSVYGWAARQGHVPRGFNPASDIQKFREAGRERYLTGDELKRLGDALHEAETVGLPWTIRAHGETSKHVPKNGPQRVVYPVYVTGAIRLLLLTGCRLGEILNLRWEEVDLDRGFLWLTDSKTGRKGVILSEAACDLLRSLPRVGAYVIPGQTPDRPRHDLKKPWDQIRTAAGLDGVRLHDLRHTHASIGAASGLGLPIVGKLLGHRSSLTTQRYAHLADDPVRRASNIISKQIAEAVGPKSTGARTESEGND
ncbi:tyrosine-type recombinase/integrase [Stappia sp. GBMRC 2046]|uniref:Tyrosine-type recombinase/integrase n=1 Tax=Stappia sediminis TaxID=2692190 RepID=A0A7X3LRQ5_9HYPH|nr:site-specific integrase [Stappia sediminis]MXN63874.1 tyrosine-type recombinase/integrase [Stappia sediminis]